MKALLVSMGTRGDIEPFLAVGEILRNRGWQVVCLFPEQFRATTEAMGFVFHGFSAEFLKLMDGSDAKEILGGAGSTVSRVKNWGALARKGMQLARESVDVQHRVQRDEAPDRIVYHPKCNIAIVWGMAHPGRAIMLSPVPGLAHAVNEFAPMWKDWGTTLNRASTSLINTIKAVAVKRFTKTLASEVDPKHLSVATIRRAMLETERTIYTVSPSLFTRPDYWPSSAHVVGYFERDKTVGWLPDAPLLKFLEQFNKIVLISFGSMTNTDPLQKTRIIVDVLARTGIPAIINTSWGGLERIDNAPEHVHFVDSIPYDWLFPRVHAVVHHGGSGSTHMTLKYGCPSLVVPHALDQPYWARLVHERGLGPRGIPIGELAADVFEERLLDLYSNDAYRANAGEMSQRMSGEADPDRLFELIANDRG